MSLPSGHMKAIVNYGISPKLRNLEQGRTVCHAIKWLSGFHSGIVAALSSRPDHRRVAGVTRLREPMLTMTLARFTQ